MKKTIKFLTVLSVMITLLVVLTVTASAADGRCGDVYWEVSGTTLRLSPVPGTNGVMSDFDSYDYAPWYYVDGNYSYEVIDNLIIEDGVTQIGSYAFAYFEKLTRVDFPSTFKSLRTEAFYKCENLREVNLYGDVGYRTFENCYNLEKVVCNGNSTYIAERAFYNCQKLKTAEITTGSIGVDAFCYCYALEDVTIHEGCVGIDNEAFYSCQSLKYLTLPASLRWVVREAFYDCGSLKTVIYYGTPHSLNNMDIDYDYNDALKDAIDWHNGRKLLYAPIQYVDQDGQVVTLDLKKTDVTYVTTFNPKLSNGWNVVMTELDFGSIRVKAAGNVNILLKDNCGITAGGGIGVEDGGTLSIYSESLNSESMGYITVTGAPKDCAGIGENSHVDTEGQYRTTINIYGGKITSNGGSDAAGIGSGGPDDDKNGYSCWTSEINIYNGDIYATGGRTATGIGSAAYGVFGARSESDITINGGKICARTYQGGEVDIGSAYQSFANVTINGGTIDATVGASHYSSANVTINGGTISGNIGGMGFESHCNVTDNRKNTGFTLSEGNWWIIAAGAAVVVGGAAAIIVSKKKKK